MAEYEKVITSEEERQIYRDYRAAWDRYRGRHQEGARARSQAPERRGARLQPRRGQGALRRRQSASCARTSSSIRRARSTPATSAIEIYASSRVMIWSSMALCALLGVLLAFVVGAHDPQRAAERARRHRAARARRHGVTFGEVDRDEVGQLLGAMQVMTASLDKVTTVSKELASGNLCVEVRERSESDELMKSLAAMVKRLTEVVVEVRGSADNVASGSLQLIVVVGAAEPGRDRAGVVGRGGVVVDGADERQHPPERRQRRADREDGDQGRRRRQGGRPGGDPDRRGDAADRGQDLDRRGDRAPDELAGAERGHRGGARGRARQGLRGGGVGGAQAGRAQPEGGGRDHRARRARA